MLVSDLASQCSILLRSPSAEAMYRPSGLGPAVDTVALQAILVAGEDDVTANRNELPIGTVLPDQHSAADQQFEAIDSWMPLI